jgi:methylmalonyl-CoA/ethylmalonyl-CoA epimerase
VIVGRIEATAVGTIAEMSANADISVFKSAIGYIERNGRRPCTSTDRGVSVFSTDTITMIRRILHIGIAVKDLPISTDLFSALFGSQPTHTEAVPEQQADIAMFPLGASSVELLASNAPDSAISKFISTRGEGIHHLCLEVDDIRGEIGRLKAMNFQFVNDEPTDGGDGYLVAFLHPRSTNGVLIELAEKTRREPT